MSSAVDSFNLLPYVKQKDQILMYKLSSNLVGYFGLKDNLYGQRLRMLTSPWKYCWPGSHANLIARLTPSFFGRDGDGFCSFFSLFVESLEYVNVEEAVKPPSSTHHCKFYVMVEIPFALSAPPPTNHASSIIISILPAHSPQQRWAALRWGFLKEGRRCFTFVCSTTPQCITKHCGT